MQEALKDIGEVAATIVCGDNYFADHQDEALEEILKVVEENCFAVTYTVSTLSSPVNLNKERQGLTSTVRKHSSMSNQYIATQDYQINLTTAKHRTYNPSFAG